MRIRTRPLTTPFVKPRSAWVLAFRRCLDSLSGRTQRLARLSRERFERLDPDQQLREVGEW